MKQKALQTSYIHVMNLDENELRQLIVLYPYPHFIGQQVLKNNNTPIEILLNHTHCIEMMNNSQLPNVVYEKILEENNYSVIGYALRVCFTPTWFIEKVLEKFPNDFGFQEDISGRFETPVHILKILSCSEHWGVRCRVASNRSVTSEILRILQHDKEPRVLISVKDKLKSLGKVSEHITWRDIPNLSIL